VFWAILIAMLEVIGIYLVLTVVSGMWQRKNPVQAPADSHVSTSFSA
jgi:hypothetical protein